MKTHELHTILHDINHQLEKENPSLEFKAEAIDNAASLMVIYPDGGMSKFHVNITEEDEVLPQPGFYAVPEVNSNRKEINDQELKDKWITMLRESLNTKGFEYFYDEVGGEG